MSTKAKIARDAELTRWREQANRIREDGRWAAANTKIAELCARPAREKWLVTVFASLTAAVFSEYLALEQAYKDPTSETSLMAWRARNLLELAVWCMYCGRSRENAQRVYADAGRDLLNVIDAFQKWAGARGHQLTGPQGEQAKTAIRAGAAAQGIDSLDGAYQSVSAAASAVGIGPNFSLANKMLSKFAHPTAMQIFAAQDDEKAAYQKAVFFNQGCVHFIGAFDELERQLISLSSEK